MLGGLFAFVLTLPFGFAGYIHFCTEIALSKLDQPIVKDGLEALMLVVPFILGFSTPLVIMILNQFIEAAQAFFGKRSSPPLVTGAPSEPAPSTLHRARKSERGRLAVG
jgi:hypothetical protein